MKYVTRIYSSNEKMKVQWVHRVTPGMNQGEYGS
jgi:hypothetical protein